jgi:TatD DNase family protein
MMMPRLIDSHCHLDFDGLSDRLPDVLAAMASHDVVGCMTIGVTLEEAPRVLAIAAAHEQIFASVGVHPEYSDHQEPDTDTLCRLGQHPKVLAIGETGLDYHWHKDQPEWQRERFRIHIRAAKQLNKPLVVHTRDAAEDTLRILREEGAESVGGIMHCFTESYAVAEAAMAMGFYISLSGIVSFKKAEQVHDAG